MKRSMRKLILKVDIAQQSSAIKTSVLAHIRLSHTGKGGETRCLVCIHRSLCFARSRCTAVTVPSSSRFAERHRGRRDSGRIYAVSEETMAEKFNGPESCMSRGCSFERVMHVRRTIYITPGDGETTRSLLRTWADDDDGDEHGEPERAKNRNSRSSVPACLPWGQAWLLSRSFAFFSTFLPAG